MRIITCSQAVDRNSADRNSADRNSADRNSADRNSADRNSVNFDRASADPAAVDGVEWLAQELYGLLASHPAPTLGLATGSTPEGVYARVAELLRNRPLDLSAVTAFALDEYLGLPAGHPESYREYLRRHVIEPWGLDPQRVHLPGCEHPAPGTTVLAGEQPSSGTTVPGFDAAIAAAGGVDLQILGIGHNGHIGFNEPGTDFCLGTHVVTLAQSTREANARFFDSLDAVPETAVTQGPATILRAKRIVLLAFGEAKADAVAAALEGPVTERVPASVLQRHPDVTAVLDTAAARLLRG